MSEGTELASAVMDNWSLCDVAHEYKSSSDIVFDTNPPMTMFECVNCGQSGTRYGGGFVRPRNNQDARFIEQQKAAQKRFDAEVSRRRKEAGLPDVIATGSKEAEISQRIWEEVVAEFGSRPHPFDW